MLHLGAANLGTDLPNLLQLFMANTIHSTSLPLTPNCCLFGIREQLPEKSGVKLTADALHQQLLLANNFHELIQMSTRVQTKIHATAALHLE